MSPVFYSIIPEGGGTGLATASPGPWATCPVEACPWGAELGVPGPEAGDAALDPMKDTGVLQPEAGREPIWATEPGFMGGAGDGEADGGLDPIWPVKKQVKIHWPYCHGTTRKESLHKRNYSVRGDIQDLFA